MLSFYQKVRKVSLLLMRRQCCWALFPVASAPAWLWKCQQQNLFQKEQVKTVSGAFQLCTKVIILATGAPSLVIRKQELWKMLMSVKKFCFSSCVWGVKRFFWLATEPCFVPLWRDFNFFLSFFSTRKRWAGDPSRCGTVSNKSHWPMAFLQVVCSLWFTGCLLVQERNSERVPAHWRRLQFVRQPRQRQRLRELLRWRTRPHLGHTRAAKCRWVSDVMI